MKEYYQKVNNIFCNRVIPFLCVVLLHMGLSMPVVHAQTVTYSENFTNAQASTAQCASWGTFQTALNPGTYHTMRIWGTNDMTGLTCTDFTTVNAMATAMKNASTYISGTVQGHVWSVCNRYAGEVWIDPPASCSGSNCPSPGYIVRPCIGGSNSNWGGINTATCGAPTQLMAIEFIAGPPCPLPSALVTNTVYSTSASFSWTAAASGTGYEYIVTTTATGPAGVTVPGATHTSATSGSVTGLLPSTNYYVHLRNKCDSPSKSAWVSVPFTTLPPCVVQPKFQVPYLDSTNATITWQSSTTALDFKYIVSTSSAFPPTGPASTTSTNSFSISQLTPGTVYYVFVMARCIGGDSSGWVLDSFYVPNLCRAPQVEFSDLNSERVVAYWQKPISAYEYEIINSSSIINNPVSGIKIPNPSYLLPYLNSGAKYYIYARTYCDDRGVKTISPWSSSTYTTWKLGVDEAELIPDGLNIYPNPVETEMTITVGGAIMSNATITVLDVKGRQLKLQSVSSNKVTIDVHDLPTGMYMVQYADEVRREQVKFNKK